jgi:hypothetical protein
MGDVQGFPNPFAIPSIAGAFMVEPEFISCTGEICQMRWMASSSRSPPGSLQGWLAISRPGIGDEDDVHPAGQAARSLPGTVEVEPDLDPLICPGQEKIGRECQWTILGLSESPGSVFRSRVA